MQGDEEGPDLRGDRGKVPCKPSEESISSRNVHYLCLMLLIGQVKLGLKPDLG